MKFHIAAIVAAVLCLAGAATQPAAPMPRKVPHLRELHGDSFVDDYFWLRDRTNPEVLEYLKAENAYAESVLAPTKTLAKMINTEIVARVLEDDEDVPHQDGGWMYWERVEKGKDYRIHFRASASDAAKKQLVFDVNEMAKGHDFCSVRTVRPSDDGRLLLYQTNFVGGIDWTMHIRDIAAGTDLPDRIENFRGGAWAADNRTIFYLVHDESKRAYRLMRHVLGQRDDQLLCEEPDRAYDLEIDRTRDGKFIVITSVSTDSTEVRVLRADHADAAPLLILPRRTDVEYFVDHHGDHFYIRINDKGKNFRLVRAPVADPSEKNWEELIAHDADVVLEEIDLFRDFCAVTERRAALPHIRVMSLAGEGQSHQITFPDAVYEVSVGENRVFDSPVLRLRYESLATPPSTYDYDMQTRTLALRKRHEVKDDFDPSKYRTERIWATAGDGTKIPISLVYRSDKRTGGTPAPLLLEGYGSYGYPESTWFDAPRISLLDRGVIYAIAHIRGGGEFGKRWHDGGRLLNKKNTFTDFIACAEYLIQQGYTSSDKLAIRGGSAGGLLMGAVLNMRPDLFKVALVGVPFVDVINTMLDDSLPLTAQEFREWGNPSVPAEYRYMLSYSPYENIEAKSYPNILVRTGINDSQVMYWEPAKYVARMRQLKIGNNLLLLRTELSSGHGGPSGRYGKWRETSEDLAFVLDVLNIKQ